MLQAFLLTLLAGLSTGIGGLIAFFSKSDNKNFLSASLGFSAGVMLYVSFVDIFQKSNVILIGALGEKAGSIVNVIGFFAGMFFIMIIDNLIPEDKNLHEMKPIEVGLEEDKENDKLLRTGLMTALAIGIHNFPEGIATFIAALDDPVMAIPIVVAIAIHNIPEGIAVSVPIYRATGSKKKALLVSTLSGLAEPVGALVGWIFLQPFLNDITFGLVFASVAGIMVYISIDELLPSAREHGNHHLSILGLIFGMIVMAVSLLFFI
ncbi:MAG: zinc transporter ZupT [Tissierellia bacterium]|nr:zinc transporter ZupT [Tissierellia bacterium]